MGDDVTAKEEAKWRAKIAAGDTILIARGLGDPIHVSTARGVSPDVIIDGAGRCFSRSTGRLRGAYRGTSIPRLIQPTDYRLRMIERKSMISELSELTVKQWRALDTKQLRDVLRIVRARVATADQER